MTEPKSTEPQTGSPRKALTSGVRDFAANYRTLIAWVLLLAALTASFAYNFGEMWKRWYPAWKRSNLSLYDRLVEGQSYYTHGPIIPAVSLLIIVLLIRHVKVPIRPSKRSGIIVLIFSLLLHLVACRAQQVNFASGIAFIGVLTGLVLLLWGAAALKRLWFPIALLLFTVPMPEFTISQVNFRLKILATDCGVAIANMMGILVEKTGNRVFLEGNKTLIIANVCNGLRTLISLLAFGSLYAYVCRLRGWWRMGLFAMTIPVAIVSNSIRIVSLILVADIWTVEAATGWFHDTSGMLIFVLAFILMFALERFILWAREYVGRPAIIVPLFDGQLRDDSDENQWGRMLRTVGSTRGFVIGGVIALAAVGAWWLALPGGQTISDEIVKNAVPARLTINNLEYSSKEGTLDAGTLTTLEHPSYLLRRYENPETPSIDFCLIFSRNNRKGTHPPDLCLAGEGQGIVAKGDIYVDGIEGRKPVSCRELIVQDHRSMRYFVYTYKCGGVYTRSFWVQQLIIFVNGLFDSNASGGLIRISTDVVDNDIDDARRRSADMLRVTIPHLDKTLP